MTSRYSPVNHICSGPLGVVTSMHTSRVPPTRTSILATGIVAPAGPYQAAKCSGCVHICQIRPTGASNIRSIVTASCEPTLSVMVSLGHSVVSQLREVVVHPIEAGFPDGPVLLCPGCYFGQWARVEGTRPVLGEVAAGHQPGPLECLDVFGDCRQCQLEWCRQLVDGGLASRKTSKDRSPRGIDQRGEGLAEPVVVPAGHRHGAVLSCPAN